MASLKIAFMGTPDFAVPALRALLDSAHDVACVYTQPPRPKGRGQKVQPSPVHLVAEERGLPVRTPSSLRRDESAQREFAALGLDVAVVAAYGLLLPQAVLAAPRFGCLNIHASLLPRWRGASPIQRAVWAGDAESGVSIMQMDEGLDTGPVVAMRALPLSGHVTTPALHDALGVLGAAMIVETLDRLAAAGRLDAEKQDDSRAVYAPLLTKEDGRIDWTKSASEIDRQIRALNPWPGVYTADGAGRRLKILAAEPAAPQPGRPGEVADRQGHVVCGAGTALRLLSVQPENAKAMDAAAAANGNYLKPGDILGGA